MELIKKNIHMDRVKCKAATQITLEDDINISDSKPDVSMLVLDKGQIKLEEMKPANDQVHVKGKLLFAILYQTKDATGKLTCMEGSIPFEEKVYMEGVTSTDRVTGEWEMEDLTTGMINSRKLSVQAVAGLKLRVEELYDEETSVEIYQEDAIEYRKQNMEIAQIAIQKNDIFRIKEELTIPQNYPNIFEILWHTVDVGDIEFRTMDEKLSVQGEVRAFFLYEGEGEDQPIHTFETTIPFSGEMDCHGCREQMVPCIQYEMGHMEVDVRPDFDGEERMIALDMALEINMKLYEEENVDILSDVYGVTKEVEAVTGPAEYKKLLLSGTGKYKINDRLKINSTDSRVLQLLHHEGEVQIDSQMITPEGIEMTGTLHVRILYITGDDANPYQSVSGMLPFTYTMEVADMDATDQYLVQADMEQMAVNMLDSEELDVKAVIRFQVVAFKQVAADVINDIKVTDLDHNKLAELPSIVAYVVKAGDNLWNIGKKYYVPVADIKEMNHITGDEIQPGEKLLL